MNFSQQLQFSNRGNSARLAEYGVSMVTILLQIFILIPLSTGKLPPIELFFIPLLLGLVQYSRYFAIRRSDMSDGAFAHGQTYVALSRCKSIEGLYLATAIRKEDVIVDPEVIDFMKRAVVLSE